MKSKAITFLVVIICSLSISDNANSQSSPVYEEGVVASRAKYQNDILGSRESAGKESYKIKDSISYSRLNMIAAEKRRAIDSGRSLASILQIGGATSYGPDNFPGRITSIATDRGNFQRLMVGTPNGGIWETRNQGQTWSPIGDLMPSLSISKIIISKYNSAKAYAATGERGSIGAGLFKSIDSGSTWSLIASTDPALDSKWRTITSFLEHPSDPLVLYAGLASGHLMKSSDGGGTWTIKSSGNPGGVCDIEADLSNANNLTLGACAVGPIKYSIDGGETWQLASSPSHLGNADLAFAKSRPGTVYALLESSAFSGELWKSVNYGRNFSRVSTTSHVGGNPYYNNVVWVDPACYSPPLCDQHIIIGGTTLWRSVDGGLTFSQITPYGDVPIQNVEPYNLAWEYPHVDNHVIVESSNYVGSANGRIYFGTDGGIYATDSVSTINSNSSVGWINLGRGLETTQFYSFSYNQTDEFSHPTQNSDLEFGFAIGGTQDNGTLVRRHSSFDFGLNRWRKIAGGDGGKTTVAPRANLLSPGSYLLGSLQNASLWGLRSTLAGAGPVCEGLNFGGCVNGSSETEFIAPLESTNRIVDARFYSGDAWLGGRSLWRLAVPLLAYDYGQLQGWESVFTFSSNIVAMEVVNDRVDDPSNQILWVALRDGSIFRVSDLTAVLPSVIRKSSVTCTGMVRSIRAYDDFLYVTCGGFDGPNILVSGNEAQNWSSMQGDLTPQPVFDIKAHLARRDHFYAATESGLWVTANAGVNWLPITDIPSVRISEIYTRSNEASDTLYLATFGRGVITYRTIHGTLSFGGGGGYDFGHYPSGRLYENLVFTVRDRAGLPLQGVRVDFSGEGLLLQASSGATDANGNVSVTLRTNSSSPGLHYVFLTAEVQSGSLIISPTYLRFAVLNL